MTSQKISSGILIFKRSPELKVFLVHPGGPFWKNKDEGAWSIPKGEIDDGNFSQEAMLKNAKRELEEETGISPPEENEKYFYLGEIKQKSGKVVHAWAYEGDWSGLLMCSSFAEIEWPHKSGERIKVPEVDKAGFFTIAQARKKINSAQSTFLDKLEEKLK